MLVAPLDWGLGHATRCIPVIRELLRQGCDVLLAGEGKQKILLQQEFPALRFLHLPGYRIQYASSAWGLATKIVAQIPNLLSAINTEQAWLKKVVKDERIDAVISDNRYGLHHPKIRCVFVTHQLRIQAPLHLFEEGLQRLNYRYINRFDECWVPDAGEEDNLAGALAHPFRFPSVPVHYTGPLSRFSEEKSGVEAKHLLLLLSGPEPQRTLLETIFLEALKDYRQPAVLVRGLPGKSNELCLPSNVSVYNHLPAAELERRIRQAPFVISRCGYSTAMDLAALKRRSILIPTPGQTEQEYLASHLMQKNFALCIAQKKFRLKQALALAKNFPYRFFDVPSQALGQIVLAFIEKLKMEKKSVPNASRSSVYNPGNPR